MSITWPVLKLKEEHHQNWFDSKEILAPSYHILIISTGHSIFTGRRSVCHSAEHYSLGSPGKFDMCYILIRRKEGSEDPVLKMSCYERKTRKIQPKTFETLILVTHIIIILTLLVLESRVSTVEGLNYMNLKYLTLHQGRCLSEI